MSDTPDLSTLPQRMLYAAGVLDEAGMKLRRNTHTAWYTHELRETATLWEAGLAERQRWATELARDIARARGFRAGLADLDALSQQECREQAERLIESGWRKGGSDA